MPRHGSRSGPAAPRATRAGGNGPVSGIDKAKSSAQQANSPEPGSEAPAAEAHASQPAAAESSSVYEIGPYESIDREGHTFEAHHIESRSGLNRAVANYDGDKAPTLKMPTGEHQSMSVSKHRELINDPGHDAALGTADSLQRHHEMLVDEGGVPNDVATEAVLQHSGDLFSSTPLHDPEAVASALAGQSAYDTKVAAREDPAVRDRLAVEALERDGHHVLTGAEDGPSLSGDGPRVTSIKDGRLFIVDTDTRTKPGRTVGLPTSFDDDHLEATIESVRECLAKEAGNANNPNREAYQEGLDALTRGDVTKLASNAFPASDHSVAGGIAAKAAAAGVRFLRVVFGAGPTETPTTSSTVGRTHSSTVGKN